MTAPHQGINRGPNENKIHLKALRWFSKTVTEQLYVLLTDQFEGSVSRKIDLLKNNFLKH